jgi:hypothetical protein
LFGHESRAEFGEGLAPEEHLHEHHGNTVFFRTREAERPVPFPAVPWAVEVAKEYANLSGQLVKPGVDNGPGPVAGHALEELRLVRCDLLSGAWCGEPGHPSEKSGAVGKP